MLIKRIDPSGDLEFLIDHYLVLQSDDFDTSVYNDRFIPDGLIGLVYNFTIQQVKYFNLCDETLPSSFLVVPKLISTIMEIVMPADSLIIIFKTSVFSRVFGIDLNIPIPNAHLVFNIFGDYPMFEKLKGIKNAEEKIAFLECFIRENYLRVNYSFDDIDEIYLKILHEAWNNPIHSIVSEHKLSSRTFRRNFHKRVGITAKSLARIVRVNYLWQKISSGEIKDFQSIAFLGNFYDQSHFINDFKKIVGETPKSFFKRNLDQVKLISGKIA